MPTLLAGRAASSRWPTCSSTGISRGCPVSRTPSGTASTPTAHSGSRSPFRSHARWPVAESRACSTRSPSRRCDGSCAIADYPAEWEPSGWDFLSSALTEAELMASFLPEDEFAAWLDGFLPRIGEGEPATLFTPVAVSDRPHRWAHRPSRRAESQPRLVLATPCLGPSRDRPSRTGHARRSGEECRCFPRPDGGERIRRRARLAFYALLLLTAEPVRP